MGERENQCRDNRKPARPRTLTTTLSSPRPLAIARHSNGDVVIGGTFVGVFEAETAEAAIEKAWKKAHVSLCHHCSREISDPEVDELHAELILDESAARKAAKETP